MQKWEYLYLSNNEKDYSINGVSYKYNPGENVFLLLNKLGKDGWELIAEPQLDAHTFKRPIEG